MISITEEKIQQNSTDSWSEILKKTRNRKKFPQSDKSIYQKPKASITGNVEIVDAPHLKTGNKSRTYTPPHFYSIV